MSAPIARGQGNERFRTSTAIKAAKRGQTVPYDVNGAPQPTGMGELAYQGTINNSDWSGADLEIENGGTGASSPAAARDNLNVISITDGDERYLRAGHAVAVSARAVSIDVAVTTTDYAIGVDASAGNRTVTLPALSAGRVLVIKKLDATANLITISGPDDIDGATSLALTSQYETRTLLAGSTEWWVV